MDSTNKSLAARLALGEESGFAELYDACADRLHRYLAIRLGSLDSASDVLQATFLRAVGHRRRFSRVENPVAYLFQMARNEATRFRSRQAIPTRRLSGNEKLATPAPTSTWEDAEAASVALGRLDAEDRELVELKVFAGLTFREIGDVTGQPLGTVATRYRRALESLRAWSANRVSLG